MFSLAVENEYLSQNPVAKVRRLRESEKRERVMASSKEAVIREAMEANPAPYYDLAEFFTSAVNTGMRAKEIVGLQFYEVDFARREINLPAERTKEGRPKAVPINPVVLEAPKRAESDRGGGG